MKDFNLEKALAGASVVDEQGNPAIYLTTCTNKLFGVIHFFKVCEGTTYEDVEAFDKNGLAAGVQKTQKLSMAPVKKTIWVNVFQNGYGVIFTCTRPFETKERAEQGYASNKTEVYLGAYSIEVEI
jgi:hypothetical protein